MEHSDDIAVVLKSSAVLQLVRQVFRCDELLKFTTPVQARTADSEGAARVGLSDDGDNCVEVLHNRFAVLYPLRLAVLHEQPRWFVPEVKNLILKN